VAECLPLYRSITRVEVVGGASTSFWFDKCRPGGPLSDCFPALFSHCTRPHATVVTVASQGLELQPRLSSVAERELSLVHGIIDTTVLS
jgi:hypothetical protein